jgi:type III pantothenate kinase
VILAVDAGNSRIKWALHERGGFTREGWAPAAEPGQLALSWGDLPQPAAIVVSNVAGERVGAELQQIFSGWKAGVVWVAGRRSQCGVTCLYERPEQLGPDRWAAAIGARSLEKRACLVVNAGTAMTVDALSAAGEFQGGIIVPGFDLMHEALGSNTARLSSSRGTFETFPRSTADAITSGAIHALCGAVERMAAVMEAAGHATPALLVGGGSAPTLTPHLSRPARVVEKLVLEGLVCIGLEQS